MRKLSEHEAMKADLTVYHVFRAWQCLSSVQRCQIFLTYCSYSSETSGATREMYYSTTSIHKKCPVPDYG